jgi:hypothetical protein
LVKKGGFDHKYSKNKFKNIFFWFIWIRLMRTVSGSFHGPKKLGPNDSYGQFIVKIWVPEKRNCLKTCRKTSLSWAFWGHESSLKPSSRALSDETKK